MRNDARHQVIWLGPPPSDEARAKATRQEFGRRRLNLIYAADVSEVITRAARDTRAVLVPSGPDLRQQLAALFFPVLNTGAALAVVLPSAASKTVDRLEANTAIASVKRPVSSSRVRVLEGWAIHVVAEVCAAHTPGPDANNALDIQPVADLEIPEGSSPLLRRAFHDFDQIRVKSLKGGRSASAGVWRVDAERGSRRPEPFVVKIGELRTITDEIETTTDYVLDFVPFPHRPPLVIDRCVESATERVIVSMFVDRATRLDHYLTQLPPALPAAALFDGPLRRWRANRHREHVQLGQEFTRYGTLPKATALQQAYDVAHKVATWVSDPDTLIDIIRGIPKLEVYVCHAHGDLHPRNIFVRHSGTDVVLIDFASSRYESPVSRDPATLDVALALDAVEGREPLPEAILRRIYEPPLLPPIQDISVDSRVEAIQQIRSHAYASGVVQAEYQLAVACYLLRFASYYGETPQGSLAYELAARIVSTQSTVPVADQPEA